MAHIIEEFVQRLIIHATLTMIDTMDLLRLGFEYFEPTGPVANGYPFDISTSLRNEGQISQYFEKSSNVFIGEFLKLVDYLKLKHECVAIGSEKKRTEGHTLF